MMRFVKPHSTAQRHTVGTVNGPVCLTASSTHNDSARLHRTTGLQPVPGVCLSVVLSLLAIVSLLPATMVQAAELSTESRVRAQAIARTSLDPATPVTALPVTSAPVTRHVAADDKVAAVQPLTGIHTLLVEARTTKTQQPDTSSLIADVFYYNYEREQTLYRQVDVSADSVLVEKTLETHHLPLTDIEQATVIAMIESHEPTRATINQELTAAQTRDATDHSTLDYKVSIYEPDAPLASLTQDDIRYRCQLARCALVTITTNRFLSLSIQPVVFPGTGELSLLRHGNAR